MSILAKLFKHWLPKDENNKPYIDKKVFQYYEYQIPIKETNTTEEKDEYK